MRQLQNKLLKGQDDILRTNAFSKEWLTEESVDDEWANFATHPIVEEGVWVDEYQGGDDDDEEEDDYPNDDDFLDTDEDDDD